VTALAGKLSETEDALQRAGAEAEEKYAARLAALQKEVEEEAARREQVERQADARIQEAVERHAAEAKQQLEDERATHRKRELQLQQRLAQFEGNLAGTLEEIVRVKTAAETAKQSAMADSMGQGSNSVVRAALSRAKSHMLSRGTDMHAPRSPAQKALLAGKTPVRPPVRPPKHRAAPDERS